MSHAESPIELVMIQERVVKECIEKLDALSRSDRRWYWLSSVIGINLAFRTSVFLAARNEASLGVINSKDCEKGIHAAHQIIGTCDLYSLRLGSKGIKGVANVPHALVIDLPSLRATHFVGFEAV